VTDGSIPVTSIGWRPTFVTNCFFTKRYVLLVRNKALVSMATARGRFDFVEGVVFVFWPMPSVRSLGFIQQSGDVKNEKKEGVV
jgi:hypothetical protein